MATVWFRSNTEQEWRTTMNWRSLPKHKAHEIADRYNQKYDSMYWVTEIGKPETDKVPKGKE